MIGFIALVDELEGGITDGYNSDGYVILPVVGITWGRNIIFALVEEWVGWYVILLMMGGCMSGWGGITWGGYVSLLTSQNGITHMEPLRHCSNIQ